MEDWLEALARIDDPEQRTDFLEAVPARCPSDAPARLHASILESLHSDRPRALRLNAAIQQLAQLRADAITRAWAARSQGHISHVTGEYAKAVEEYGAAAKMFEAEGIELEVGRTLSSSLQALIFRGQYEEAEQWAARAETIFRRHNDRLRLARLDSNVGNIYFRRDRPHEAAARYEKALEGFEAAGQPWDVAAALSNLAVCNINLGQFPTALAYYQKARDYAQAHALTNLVARADYNIAYLYYLRGDYVEARKLYKISREHSRLVKDAYHAALCDLDEAEIDLELNLTGEGERMAKSAAKRFGRLSMPYEQGKALVSLAVAASQRRDYTRARRSLLQARRVFVQEKNQVWTALANQLRAVVAFYEMDFAKARRLSESAWRVLNNTAMPGRAAQSQMLIARLWLRAGHPDRAREVGLDAVRRAGEDVSPSLRFHANLLQGEIYEIEGDAVKALEAFEAARRDIEDLRSRVDTEDLRISILVDKLSVYEGMVALCLNSRADGNGNGTTQALALVEQAKSRSLADKLAAPDDNPDHPAEDPQIQELRRDLNWIYRRLHQGITSGSGADPDRPGFLRQRARDLESEIARLTSHRPAAPTHSRPSDGANVLQSHLREGELLVEYYEARGTLYAFLISRSFVDALPLGPASPIKFGIKLLKFQIARYRWAKAISRTAEANLKAISYHLGDIYRLLIAPFEDRLAGFEHLIFAPHKDLHGLPFGALSDGRRSLIDAFTISAIPSASVLARCRQKQANAAGDAVVIAAPDPRAPRIEEEARGIAGLLPGAKLFLGADASLEAFQKHAPAARILHFSTHGIFRRDNPVFSALQLSDARLSLVDLYRMRLQAELLTLSGCHTGSSVVVGGDELVGLMRGFLEAGARSLLVALWDIDDSATQQFMRYFYDDLRLGYALGSATQRAMQKMREHLPDPYLWAPFLLVGDPAITIFKSSDEPGIGGFQSPSEILRA
ncbi:MAG: CHAT domain-containing protein [Bryobacterales bacterium]|nr:CHAT domain-containing protein [Bryobacterales bacterium]